MNRSGFQKDVVAATVRSLAVWTLVIVGATAAVLASPDVVAAQPDAFAYDYGSRIFNGLYQNADRNSANNNGDPTRLRMEMAYPTLRSAGNTQPPRAQSHRT